MLAEIFTLLIVGLAVLGPGYYLYSVARQHHRTTALIAQGFLIAAGALVAWLFSPFEANLSQGERLELFIAAWAGGITIGAIVLDKLRQRKKAPARVEPEL
jgi:Zn-dependent protease with chaperone function